MEMINDKIGLFITRCLKDFINIDNEHIPVDILDQEADGNVYLEFSDGSCLLLAGVTENLSLMISDNLDAYSDDLSRFRNISKNNFWSTKINKKITQIEVLYFDELPFGVRFYLNNGEKIEITYESRTEFDFDTTVIRGGNV